MLKDSTAAAACPVLIQNHCHPVGLCSTSGGCSSTARAVSLRMRVSSSRRAITRRARLSQVEVNIKVSPLPRITLAVACPLRPLYPAPRGSTARRSIGNAIFTSLAGTGRRVRTDCLALCRLSLKLRTVVTIGAGLLQLAPDRAIVPMTARNGFRHRAVQPGNGPVEFSVFILNLYQFFAEHIDVVYIGGIDVASLACLGKPPVTDPVDDLDREATGQCRRQYVPKFVHSFIYDLQEVPARFHVGHHGRHSILYLRDGCCQGAHGGTVGHIGYAGGRNLHGCAYMPDVARCIILRRRCPAIDKVRHREASVEAAVILQQLDEGTVAVGHRPELAERLVLRGANLPLPAGGGGKAYVAGVVVAQSPGHSVCCLHSCIHAGGIINLTQSYTEGTDRAKKCVTVTYNCVTITHKCVTATPYSVTVPRFFSIHAEVDELCAICNETNLAIQEQ